MPHSVSHHIHVRARVHRDKRHPKATGMIKDMHQNAEPFPHPDKRIMFLDKLCLLFSVLMPLTAIPQVIELYVSRNPAGISLLMWVLWCVGVIPFLIYGIVHRAKPLIVLNTLWLLMQALVIIGVLIYS